MKGLNRVYRFVGQSLFWVFFGLVGLIVGFVVLPLVHLFVPNRDARQTSARKVISACFSSFVWAACKTCLITLDVSGLEHYDPGRSQLILANHPTLIDVVILLSLFPQVDCVIKEAVTRNPVMRTAVGAANYISNREPSDLLVSCVDRLNTGASLLLFPEGTRSVAGNPLTFKAGAAEVALRADAELLLVVIDCKPQFLAKHEPWYFIPRKAPHFSIRILAPIAAAALVEGNVGNRQARHLLNDKLRGIFETELA